MCCVHAHPAIRIHCCSPLTRLHCTQLDILAANASGGRLAGSVLLNGTPCRMAEFRRLSCYVMQRDVLLDSATVSLGVSSAFGNRLSHCLTSGTLSMHLSARCPTVAVVL